MEFGIDCFHVPSQICASIHIYVRRISSRRRLKTAPVHYVLRVDFIRVVVKVRGLTHCLALWCINYWWIGGRVDCSKVPSVCVDTRIWCYSLLRQYGDDEIAVLTIEFIRKVNKKKLSILNSVHLHPDLMIKSYVTYAEIFFFRDWTDFHAYFQRPFNNINILQ